MLYLSSFQFSPVHQSSPVAKTQQTLAEGPRSASIAECGNRNGLEVASIFCWKSLVCGKTMESKNMTSMGYVVDKPPV